MDYIDGVFLLLFFFVFVYSWKNFY